MFVVRLASVASLNILLSACVSAVPTNPASTTTPATRASALDVQTVVGETISGLCVRDPIFGCAICVGGTCTDARPVLERASFARTKTIRRATAQPRIRYYTSPPLQAPVDPCSPETASYSLFDAMPSSDVVVEMDFEHEGHTAAPTLFSPAAHCRTCNAELPRLHAQFK